MPEPLVQYLRGDKQHDMRDHSRSAFHRYVHTYFDDVEDMYRDEIFKLST